MTVVRGRAALGDKKAFNVRRLRGKVLLPHMGGLDKQVCLIPVFTYLEMIFFL